MNTPDVYCFRQLSTAVTRTYFCTCFASTQCTLHRMNINFMENGSALQFSCILIIWVKAQRRQSCRLGRQIEAPPSYTIFAVYFLWNSTVKVKALLRCYMDSDSGSFVGCFWCCEKRHRISEKLPVKAWEKNVFKVKIARTISSK